MNTRFLFIYNLVLTALIIWIFILLYSPRNAEKIEEPSSSLKAEKSELTDDSKEKKSFAYTGKIAFINIDTLNEKSEFVADLVKKLKVSKTQIEASLESLQQQYQQKVKEYQTSASAGIAPESELAAKAREIQAIEKEAQNKQIQMDNLAMELNEKNEIFQREVKKLIEKEYGSRYDFILSYSDAVPVLLYGNPGCEITREVVELINAEYRNKKSKKDKK